MSGLTAGGFPEIAANRDEGFRRCRLAQHGLELFVRHELAVKIIRIRIDERAQVACDLVDGNEFGRTKRQLVVAPSGPTFSR